MINFVINNIPVIAQKGESILQVARREGIYIPTMCYLAKTTPNASCRMCSVEAKGVDGFVLSCNTPPIEGLEVTTDSDALYKERQNIMKLYNVNHPLQCGVCDKSGECELQNKTLEFSVAEQSFAAKEQKRKKKQWGVLSYDPYLCILCEKCTAVCNEVVGAEALYIKPGGYKSAIDNDYAQCIQCGECIAVCPVGAMASSDFKYNSNAWELKKVPSACAHCSSACSLNYEVKHVGVGAHESEKIIYRVTNEHDHDSLCGAGRFGFDFENRVTAKDEKAFSNVLKAFEYAKTIRFSSMITNEEAYILQKLKEKHGYRLINDEARAYQKFIQAYSLACGNSLYSANLDLISKSDYAVTLGCSISSDNPMVRFALAQAVKRNKAYVAMMHPIEDESIRNIVSQHFKHEVGSEEGLLAMLCECFVNVEGKKEHQDFFDSLDGGYISGESSIGEEEFELLAGKKNRKKAPVLILGADLYAHPRAENIAKMAGVLDRYSDFSVLIIPSDTNTLGVSLICELDEEALSPVIAYNAFGDTVLSALGEGDLDMPALNQQEGTFTSIDKKVVPLNAALPYQGYELSDISNKLGVKCVNVIDFTSKLPHEKGYKAIAFDDLPNYYLNSGIQVRGYLLDAKEVKEEISLEEISDIKEFNGTVIYSCNPNMQFNLFTDKAEIIVDKALLKGSKQFAQAAKIKGGENVEFMLDGKLLSRKFQIDNKLKGMIAYNANFDLGQRSSLYRYQQIQLERVQ
ncbi:MAG: ferredoxin [Helicobacteraceae bacterium CG1_02_36_14]|nr:MAG: ferredoxin [Helicobacteraceae bacterium CG1_02_36_14]